MRTSGFLRLFVYLSISSLASSILAAGGNTQGLVQGRISDEMESDGGHSMGFGLGGVAAASDLSSVKTNPAMLSLEKQYRIFGGYNWPSFGRDYYQAGVVDSKTSPIAAGFSYTATTKEFKTADFNDLKKSAKDMDDYLYGTMVQRRVAVGFSQSFEKVSLGIGGQYVTGDFYSEGKKNGAALNIGAVMLLTPKTRFALSAENLANSKIVDLAPRVYRVGVAQMLFSGDLTLHLDYRQRQRIFQEQSFYDSVRDAVILEELSSDEKLIIASGSVRIQDLLRIVGGAAQSLSGDGRGVLSGGLALVNNSFCLSYLLRKPYLSKAEVHQAVNFSVNVSL